MGVEEYIGKCDGELIGVSQQQSAKSLELLSGAFFER